MLGSVVLSCVWTQLAPATGGVANTMVVEAGGKRPGFHETPLGFQNKTQD